MAITVNGRKIRSLPEQVTENSKRITALEQKKPNYLHSILITDNQGDRCSLYIFSETNDLIDTYEKLYEKVEKQGRLPICGWNTQDSLAAIYIWVNDQTNELEIQFGNELDNSYWELNDSQYIYEDSVVTI